jgi:hypothetical protein
MSEERSVAFVQNALDKLSPYIIKAGENEVRVFCPFAGCNDRAKHEVSRDPHLYISTTTGYWHCFLCGRGGKDIATLLTAYGIELSYLDKLQALSKFSPHAEAVIEVASEKQKNLLAEFEEQAFPVPEGSDAFLYLTRRRRLPVSVVAEAWRCWNRYPYYVFWHCRNKENRVVFYSGRSFLKNFLGPKYRHSTTQTPLLKLNLDKTMPSPASGMGRNLVFLVEGIFDAFGAPCTAIPLFGKTLPNKHVRALVKIIKEGNLAPICALDADAVDQNFKLAQTLSDYGVSEIYIFSWQKGMKDFGERLMVNTSASELKAFLHPFNPHSQKILQTVFARQT